MGKIRTKIIGLEDVEKKQKNKAKQRAEEKKKKRVKMSGLRGGEKMIAVEADEKSLEKMEKAKKIMGETVKSVKSGRTIKKVSRGKNYLQAKKAIDRKKKYKADEAISLLKKIKYAKFDEAVELHLNLRETGLKGEVELPHGTGKKLRVAIVDDKLLTEIEKGKINFNVLITHPSFMPKLVKYAKVLGPKGLMPNPKAGTISSKPEEVFRKFEKGLLRWKGEVKAPLLHQMIGKISFTSENLKENINTFLKSVGASKIQDAFVKTTMSPALRLDIEKIE